MDNKHKRICNIMVSTRANDDMDRIAQFSRLMRLGHVSYAEGNRKQAHRFWRRAAMLNPVDEQVWLALLNVLDNDEDRRVCLQNIIAINPNNVQAQKKLEAIPDEAKRDPTTPAVIQPLPAQRGSLMRHVLLRVTEIALMSILLVVGIAALQYWLTTL